MKSRRGRAAATCSRLVCLAALLGLVTGCAAVEEPVTGPRVTSDDRKFLLAPSTGYPLGITAGQARRVDEAYVGLVRDGDRDKVLALSQQLLARDAGFHPATLLAAQVAFLDGDAAQAYDLLAPQATELADYTAWQSLLGLSAEQVNDLVSAFGAYSNAAEQNPAAMAKTRELGPRVVQILAQRIEDDLSKGRTEDAATELARLELWLPDETLTLESAAAVAQATDDPEAELRAITRLSARDPDSRALAERRALLELEVGDAGAGLRVFQELAAQHPEDEVLQDRLARARFLWRLHLLPIEARDLVSQTELSRGDFAAILYWLFPEVRYGQGGQVRIANDILDHAYREEIVRVVNLGIMDVDERLHQFSPTRAVTRFEALTSMIRLLARKQPPLACTGGLGRNDSIPIETACKVGARCGLLESASDCLPALGVSGSEAVELSRLTLNLLGVAQ